MLTRLKVSGFKNLVDVDVRFGPFTCIAGANGVGKSNLLDAIAFLSALADHQLVEAAMSVRDDLHHKSEAASIFHRHGSFQENTMSFEAEMIIPKQGTDDLGQKATATTSFVRYTLKLKLRPSDAHRNAGLPIEILHEGLTHIRANEAKRSLGFNFDGRWFKGAVTGKRWAPWYISTSPDQSGSDMIYIHQDGGRGGRTRTLLPSSLPRTALSASNATENPTATLVRREMQSWRRLQLEPSALRSPDNFTAPTTMGPDGSHLPATLCDLARHSYFNKDSNQPSRIYSMAANRLAELIDDVRELKVDRDEKRDLLTLLVAGKDGTFHPARALSDGTLRFLALAVLELDPEFEGLICLEEPENGIHPARIPAILNLLQDIAVDTQEPLGPDNPLRQVIINTHSPSVVSQVPEDSLLIAEPRLVINSDDKTSYEKVAFGAIDGTWRSRLGTPAIAKGKLLAYLSPVPIVSEPDQHVTKDGGPTKKARRVIDNPTMQLMLFGTRQ